MMHLFPLDPIERIQASSTTHERMQLLRLPRLKTKSSNRRLREDISRVELYFQFSSAICNIFIIYEEIFTPNMPAYRYQKAEKSLLFTA